MHSDSLDSMVEKTSLRMTQFDPSHGTLRAYGLQLAPGVILAGRFEILALLGDGGMGTVFEALDRVTQEHVAVKVLRTDLHLSVEAKQRFLAEAKVSRALSHPHIVRVHDVGVADGHHYLTMERLRGQSLRAHIKQNAARGEPIPVAVALYIARQLIDAMSYANHYIVHRDLKPENIWITEDGLVKLMDFGIARVLANLRNTHFLLGTPYYMAPEQQNDPEHVDWRADQYVVGVVLYELLIGVVPAAAAAAPHVLRKDVPKSVSKAIMKALASERTARFHSWDDFRKAITAPYRGSVSQLAAGAAQFLVASGMAAAALIVRTTDALSQVLSQLATLCAPWVARARVLARRSLRRARRRSSLALVRFYRVARPAFLRFLSVARRRLSDLLVRTGGTLRQLIVRVRSMSREDLQVMVSRLPGSAQRLLWQTVAQMRLVPWQYVRAGAVTGAALGVVFFLWPVAQKGAANASVQTAGMGAPAPALGAASQREVSPIERDLDRTLLLAESWRRDLERERVAAEAAAAGVSAKLIAAGSDSRKEQWRVELQSLRQKAQVARNSLAVARKVVFSADAMLEIEAQRAAGVDSWNQGRTDQAMVAFERARTQAQRMLDSASAVHGLVKMHSAAQRQWDEARATVSAWGGDAGVLLSGAQARLTIAEQLLNAGDTTAAQAEINQAMMGTQEATLQFLRRSAARYALLADRKIDSGDYQGARTAIDKAKRLKRLEQQYSG